MAHARVIEFNLFNGWRHLLRHPEGCPCLPFPFFTLNLHQQGGDFHFQLALFGFAFQMNVTKAAFHMEQKQEVSVSQPVELKRDDEQQEPPQMDTDLTKILKP